MKKCAWWFVAVVLFLVGLAVWNEGQRGHQYRLGMTISEVRSMTSGRFPTQKFGLDYDGCPTPQQMNEDPLFYIHDENSGMLLMFNHHEILIEKKRTKWFGINVIKILDSIRSGN